VARPQVVPAPAALVAYDASVERGPAQPSTPVRSRIKRERARPRSTAPARTVSSPEAELALLDRAQRALERDPATALALSEQHARDYPHGLFAQEREVLAIEALLKLRQRAAAVTRAEDFVKHFADSPHARRVRALLDRSQRGATPAMSSP
jgi:hypothetical protein